MDDRRLAVLKGLDGIWWEEVIIASVSLTRKDLSAKIHLTIIAVGLLPGMNNGESVQLECGNVLGRLMD